MPPDTSGRSSTRGATHSPPVPWGPMRPLWPVKHTALMCCLSMSMGNTPAVWEASRMNSSPCARQKFPTKSMSTMSPVRLEAWVQTTARVWGRSSRSKAP